MNTRLKIFGLLLACLPAVLAAQEASGTLKTVRGTATLEREGVKRPARAGETLFARDRIVTGTDGYASAGMRDQSSLAIGPNSDVDLSKYSFNPTTHQGEQQVRMRSGSLAAISGKLAKASPESVQFNVGTVTLGVRGTQFVAEVQSGAAQTEGLLWRDAQQQVIRNAYGLCWQSGTASTACPTDRFVLLPDRDGRVGAITLSTQGATMTVSKAYAGVEVEERTVRNAEFSESAIQARYQDLLATLPPAPQTYVVRFNVGSSDQLAPGSQEVIEQIRGVLARWPVVPNVDVIGHTDTAGRAEQNDALSLQRARVVSRWLESATISAERLHTSGRGERQLMVPTPDETPEPLNRRVEITVY